MAAAAALWPAGSLRADLARIDTAGGAVAGDVPGACGDVSMTQNVVATVVTSGVSCELTLPTTAETGWARAFPIGPESNFVVNCVDFGVALNNGPDFVVTVNLFTGVPTGPYAALTPLASLPVAIPAGLTDTMVTADFAAAVGGVTVPAGSTLVVEVLAPTRAVSAGGDGGGFYAGNNSAGQSAPTYIRAVECGVPDFVDLATVGFPDEHLVMRVDGGPLWWSSIEVVNNSGQPAAGLRLTLAGGGGSLLVPPGFVLAAGCPAPMVPTNAIPGDDILIDWGAACVPVDGRIVLIVRSPSGPLVFVSGEWLDDMGNVIGVIAPGRVTVSYLGIGLPPPKPFVAVKRYIRYRGIPVYGAWAKPAGQCWQRWCCFVAGGLACQDRFDICFFQSPLFRLLEIGNCRPLAGWRTFFINGTVVWILQVTTVEPPPGDPQDPPGGGPPQKPNLFAAGAPMNDRYDLEVLESDDMGMTGTPSTDFGDAFLELFDNLRIEGTNPALPPIIGLPNLLQAMAPGYQDAAAGLQPVIDAGLAVLAQESSPPLSAAVEATLELQGALSGMAAAFGGGGPGGAGLYFAAGQHLRTIGDELLVASGGLQRFSNAREYLHAMAEGMDVSGQMVLTGLPTPVEQDAYLWGQIARTQPMAESAGISLLSHVRIPLELQLPSWGPETGPVQVMLRDAGSGALLDDGLHHINEFGHVLLFNQRQPGGAYSLWTKPPTHLAVVQDVPSEDGLITPALTLVNGDADGDNCVDFADLDLVFSELGQGGEFAPFVPSSDVDRDGLVAPPDVSVVESALGQCGAPDPAAPPPCPADLDGDSVVGGADLGLLLGAWGPCPPGPCPADLNGDGVVDGADLGLLLGAWGPC